VTDQTAALALRFLTTVVPKAAAELRRLNKRARAIPDPAIRREALSSLRRKAFHVHGGCVFATFLEPAAAASFVELVATYETAVDYLDNLCDRIGTADEADFRALHESLLDAITPGAPLREYFRHRAGDDGGYLAELVIRSQASFAALPSYDAVRASIKGVTERYCELQALKHLAPGERERRCEAAFSSVAPDLTWWEAAAGCGSTMATFALTYAAATPSITATRVQAIFDAYFPYFTALHILLDYLVDQEEDRAHGELNFVACYPNADAARAGIVRTTRQTVERVASLEDADVHRFALRAMCGYYCTRPSLANPAGRTITREIFNAAGIEADERTGLPRLGDQRLQPLLELYARMSRL
jgi:tetraprenyl-beta-curcumene synthase